MKYSSLLGTLLYISESSFSRITSSQLCGRECEVTESKKSQRKKQLLSSSGLGSVSDQRRKRHRGPEIFSSATKTRKSSSFQSPPLPLPSAITRFLTSLCTEDAVSRPHFLWLQFSSFRYRRRPARRLVTPCPTEHSTGELRFGIAFNRTVIFLSLSLSLVIRPACQNNNRRRRAGRPGRDATRWKGSQAVGQPAFQRW